MMRIIDCTKTENYFAERQRMTKLQKDGICNLSCTDCPLSIENNGTSVECSVFEILYIKKAIEIVQKWSDEHPPKTYLSEFLKTYPNVKLLGDGTPKCLCPHQLGLKDINDCRKHYTCAECWNQPMPIKDGEENA